MRIGGRALPSSVRSAMSSPSRWRINRALFDKCSVLSTGTGMATCWRLSVSNCWVRPVPRSSTCCSTDSGSAIDCPCASCSGSRKQAELSTDSRLLKSCARPPASRPTASILRACSNASSERLRAVMSFSIDRMHGRPFMSIASAENSTSRTSPVADVNVHSTSRMPALAALTSAARRAASLHSPSSSDERPITCSRVRPSIARKVGLASTNTALSRSAMQRPIGSAWNTLLKRASARRRASLVRMRSETSSVTPNKRGLPSPPRTTLPCDTVQRASPSTPTRRQVRSSGAPVANTRSKVSRAIVRSSGCTLSCAAISGKSVCGRPGTQDIERAMISTWRVSGSTVQADIGAASIAIRIRSWLSRAIASVRLRSVTSCAVPTNRVARPSRSCCTRARLAIQRSSPSGRRTRNSLT